jgi:hypothetical protein
MAELAEDHDEVVVHKTGERGGCRPRSEAALAGVTAQGA